jgi:predicted  nucleic acid-binding Zn-ribbon protein
MERRIEDLEDKLNVCQDENEELRAKSERNERTVTDQKKQIDSRARKEESIIAQYSQTIDSLKRDIRELER